MQMVIRVGMLLVIYVILRVVFVIHNADLFPELDGDTFSCFVSGLRFDISAVCWSNLIFILASVLPFSFVLRKGYRRFLKVLFHLINLPMLLFLLSEVEYYRFTHSHSTIEVLSFGGELSHIGFQFLIDYWYFLVAVILLGMGMEWVYRRTERMEVQVPRLIPGLTVAILTLGFVFMGVRGGLTGKPISTIQAVEGVTASNSDIVLNSAFTLIHSLTQPSSRHAEYFADSEVSEYFNYEEVKIANQPDSLQFPGKNVVLIVMESFSQEYMTSYGAPISRTPFLDSLAGESMLFPNMMANGFRSVDGLAAILGGIPHLSHQNFITSQFQSNRFDGLGTRLKDHGYTTGFFHGGINGTLNFDHFSKRAGFDRYEGMNEYNNPEDFDGSWGIYDVPYFEYAAEEFSRMDEPFCNVLYSLSAHHPWKLPEGYEDRYEGESDMYKMVRYSDEAIRRFFEKAQHEPWFDNTIFVITSDHKGPVETRYYSWMPGFLQIPLIVYAPGEDLPSVNPCAVQQIDIMPGILNLLGDSTQHHLFGQHFFEEGPHYSYHFYRDQFVITDENHLVIFDGEKVTAGWKWPRPEKFSKKDTLRSGADLLRLENRMKSVIQTFDQRLSSNTLAEH